jgi:hypothetical protein
MIFYYLDTSVGMVYSSEYDFKSNQHREENDNKGIANECSSFTTALISVAVEPECCFLFYKNTTQNTKTVSCCMI